MAYIKEFQERRENNRSLFDKLIDMENSEKKVEALEDILKKNNTEEDYLFEFLKLKMENKENKDLEKYLKMYELGISKNKFNQAFGNYFIKKSAYEKLIDIFDKFKDINLIESKYDKLIKMIEVIETLDFQNIKFNQTFPIFYFINKELYFNSLINSIIKKIKKECFEKDNGKLLIALKNLYNKIKSSINDYNIEIEKEIEKENENVSKIENEIQDKIQNKKENENKIESGEVLEEVEEEEEEDDEVDAEYDFGNEEKEEEEIEEESKEENKIEENKEENKIEEEKDIINPKLKNTFDKITKYIKPNFYVYFDHLCQFITNIYNSFEEKYKQNDIFTNEFYETKQKNDINLFADFIFFITHFNFVVGQFDHFSNTWQETFLSITLGNINCNLFDKKIKRINNDLEVVFKKKKHTINNIDDYIPRFINILVELKKNKMNFPDCFQLLKFLKMDKLEEHIFIKSNWDILCNYFSDILTSKAVKSTYIELHKSELLFPCKEEIINILNNIRFFNYNTDFVAETKKRFLYIYIQSFSNVLFFDIDINIRKTIYLTMFLISCIHEIIGHLYIRIYNYLYDDKNDQKLLSSLPGPLATDYAKERKKESGEYIEELLFGNYGFEMKMKEILFTLDKKNYDSDYKQFNKKFVKAKSKTFKISDELKKILQLFDINLKKLNLKSSKAYRVNKSKYQISYKFPQHHSISQISTKYL